MEKEELFEQRKILKKEGKPISDREIIQDRIGKVEEFVRITDPFEEKEFWGYGLKETYPKLSDDEIKDIFLERRYEAHRHYAGGIPDAIKGVLESPTAYRKSKYKRHCREFLYNKFSQEAIAVKNTFEERKERLQRDGKFNESMTDADFQFKLAFNEFFEPVLRYEEIKQKLEEKIKELSDLKTELGQQYHFIGQDKSLIKSERKRKQAELQPRIIETKKELGPLESRSKDLSGAREILINNFIPDYRKEEELKPALEQMYNKFSKKFRKEQKEK